MIILTPHSQWVEEFLNYIKPYNEKVINHRVFDDINSCKLTEQQFHRALLYFYPLIESFPKYMALNLSKVPSGHSEWNEKTRSWLIKNIGQERLHAEWWWHWAIDFGVPAETLNREIYPPAEIDAINNYLWRVCTYGSLAEGISASNFAVEGPTGMWTQRVASSISRYHNLGRIKVTKRTLKWIKVHASYDDKHPVEALEIIKAYANTEEEKERVMQAAKRALEYYAMALDSSYGFFD